jgi:hypothetical protein
MANRLLPRGERTRTGIPRRAMMYMYEGVAT